MAGGLAPALETAARMRRPPVRLLGLRDVYDEPAATIRAWRAAGSYEAYRRTTIETDTGTRRAGGAINALLRAGPELAG